MDVHVYVVVIFFISGNFYFSASLATLPYPKTKEKQNLPETYKKLTTTKYINWFGLHVFHCLLKSEWF